ncbi:MAG: hypothetical protein AAFQ51_11300 [Pseudomonadota bacterium]
MLTIARIFALSASAFALAACTNSGGGDGSPDDVQLSSFATEQPLSTLPARTILATNNGVKSIRYGFTGTGAAREPDNIRANSGQLRPRRFRTTATPGVYDIRFSVAGSAPFVTARNVDLTTGGPVNVTLPTTNGPVDVEFQAIDGLGLSYTEAGVWQISPQNNNFVTVKGGYVTGFNTRSVPRSGSATFTGEMLGRYVNKPENVVSGVTGDVTLTASWAGAGSISGSITNVELTDGAVAGQDLNSFDVLISGIAPDGAFDEGGGVTAQAAPGNATDFTAGTNGPIAGNFFGPNAEEVGAQFRVIEDAGGANARALTGAIAAKQ